jgi:hypothetical protein
MAECAVPEHVWSRPSEELPGSQTVTMKCERCGVGHTMRFSGLEGAQILAENKILPALGASTVRAEMKTFFMASWEQACKDLENNGHSVVRGTPEIPGEAGVGPTGWASIPMVGRIAIIVCTLTIVAVLAAYVLLPAILILVVAAGVFYAITRWL